MSMKQALLQQIISQLDQEYQDITLSTTHAWWLLESLLQCSKTQLIIAKDLVLSNYQKKQLFEWIKQITHEKKPIQYIIGSVPFNDLSITVAPPILIPRPETEEWCANLITQLKTLNNQQLSILDCATGSGCIGLALAYHLPQAHVYLSDISVTALALAQKNGALHNIKNVTYIQSDLFTELPTDIQYDLIVSNPPYITSEEYANLDDTVKKWEDPAALYTADNGLAILKKIITDAPSFLKDNPEMEQKNIPQLVLEIGYKQGTLVRDLLNNAGYTMVSVHKDFAQHDRVVTGRINHVANSIIDR
jgi:release factor glutamine methyltransferase